MPPASAVLVPFPTVVGRGDPVLVQCERDLMAALAIRVHFEHSENDLGLSRIDDGHLAWVLGIGRILLDH